MKKAALAVAIVVLALVGLVFLLPFAVNSGALRTAIAHQLSEASSAEIELNGPIHFSVFPDFGIVVEDFAYRAADGAISVTAARSVASVAPLTLLSSQVRITGIELRSPRIVLADGVDAGVSAQPQSVPPDDDIFEVIASYLQRLSIDHVLVTDGEVARISGENIEQVASSIDLKLSVPGIAKPASLVASAMFNGNRMEIAADIGSLQDLLARHPASFSLSAKTSKPPHPALADISAAGSIQLAGDGSYRIAGGEIASAGQKMLLDASYVPGDKPSIIARIKAGALAYADFAPGEAADKNAAVPGDAAMGELDLSVLQALNADVELYAQSIAVGDAIARDVVIAAQLQNARLLATLDSTDIAGGKLLASLALDANAVPAISSGSLNLTSIDIAHLVALAGQGAPLTGSLSSELQYAFSGMNAVSIRNSLNLRGSASIAGGRLIAPQLESVAGPGAGVVDTLEARVTIEDIRQPLTVSGSARWNGEPVSFTASLTASDLLWEQPNTIAVNLQSQPLNASFAGTLTPAGQVSGKADISAPSLNRVMRWLGQTIDAPIGQFAFIGGISVNGDQFAMSDAAIRLDDIRANGSMSVSMAGKPVIKAALSVDELDFATLVGGENAESAPAPSAPSAIDLSALRLFNADIQLTANQLGYGKVKAGPVAATLSVAEGVAKLSLPPAGFYDGVVSANATANGAGDVASIDLVAALENVQALPLLTAAAGFRNIEGTLKANIEVSGAGADSQVFARSLRGPVALVFNDGALRGIDVAGLVRNVQSLLVAGYSPDSEAKTEFTEFSVAADIQGGVGTVSDIRLLGPFVRMSGSGDFDIAAQAIDMRLDPRVVASLDGQGSDFDVSGLGMPILVKGPLSGPAIYPDLSALLADPNRALAAISQLGIGVGGLAEEASNALGGLDGVLNGEPGTMAGGAVTDLIGQFAGGQVPAGTDGQSSGESLLNGLIGGVLGQRPPAEDAAPAVPVQAPSQAVPLPRSDPRGPVFAPAPLPAPPTQTQQPIDLIAPQVTPDTDERGNDPLRGLLDQLGM